VDAAVVDRLEVRQGTSGRTRGTVGGRRGAALLAQRLGGISPSRTTCQRASSRQSAMVFHVGVGGVGVLGRRVAGVVGAAGIGIPCGRVRALAAP
jgi:hypothetical protein